MKSEKTKKCSLKHPEFCTPKDAVKIKSRIVIYTPFNIVAGALVTAFAFVFAQVILNYINSIIGETIQWVNLLITFVILLVTILALFYFQNKKKKWEDIAEKNKIQF